MRRRTKIIIGALGLVLTAGLAPLRTVAGDEMAPSIRSSDMVWVIPGITVLQGDVVALKDPLDPSRTVLRRAIGPAGTQVRFTDDGVRVDSKRLRIKDMGKQDGYGIYKETLWSKPPARAVEWLTRRVRSPAVNWEAEAVQVPDGHWYVLADDRDNALDSRWWGPVPTTEIIGVARLRYGPSDLWRSPLELLAGTQ